MTHLFWKDKEGTKNLLSSDFTSEQEFENLILNHQELLGDDIFLITSQVRGGTKKGIPDIIGVDKDENVCIVEMKNVSVTSEIIPQVLEYALWAEQNPAEIKNLWLESNEQPEEYEIDFDKEYGVRIIIVAPLIEPSTALATEKINYPVDLIEVKRWSSDTNHFFLVNKIEPPDTKKPSPVRGKMVYDEEEYSKKRNKESVKKFMALSKELLKISDDKNWQLQLNYRKHYCAIQYGTYNVYGLDWFGTKSFGIFVTLPKNIAEQHQPKNATIHTTTAGSSASHVTKYVIDNGMQLRDYIPLFQKALETIKEKRG